MSDFSQSKFAARLQRMVSFRRDDAGLYQEIAQRLPLKEGGRLLDIGTGTGLQLKVIHETKPQMELFGLDLSALAIEEAKKALTGMRVDLRVGSISSTS